ncbi:MAG: class I tRNA ligase family protein, partial [Actinobacteria bacterium]|nr:class I tRNA ligase family protein [Actinomycetota bacterium]
PSMAVSWDDMPELDRFALVQLSDLTDRVTKAYDEWRFHVVYHSIYGYCITELSSFYLDVLKDRLYSDGADSLSRRSAQTVLARMLTTLVRLVAPILVFTAEEIWQFTPEALRGDALSVHLAGWPSVEVPAEKAEALRAAYSVVLEVREVATKALEQARNDKVVGKSQEAALEIEAPASALEILRARGEKDMADMFIVSTVVLGEAAEISVKVSPSAGDKCPRCWNHRTLLESGVCSRCHEVLSQTR